MNRKITGLLYNILAKKISVNYVRFVILGKIQARIQTALPEESVSRDLFPEGGPRGSIRGRGVGSEHAQDIQLHIPSFPGSTRASADEESSFVAMLPEGVHNEPQLRVNRIPIAILKSNTKRWILFFVCWAQFHAVCSNIDLRWPIELLSIIISSIYWSVILSILSRLIRLSWLYFHGVFKLIEDEQYNYGLHSEPSPGPANLQ